MSAGVLMRQTAAALKVMAQGFQDLSTRRLILIFGVFALPQMLVVFLLPAAFKVKWVTVTDLNFLYPQFPPYPNGVL
ncbi:MAG: hypothetical protein KAJ31_02570, partial [Deltaproteobacteria bacterium]|nr:hypothetical protein [Deltaproteobacteria bacterium]